MKKAIFGILVAFATLVTFSACEEETKTYEVNVLNECYLDVVNTGWPFLRIQIDEVKFNDKVMASNIAAPDGEGANYRTYSDYFKVSSGIDYEVKVTFTTFFYDAENMQWETEGTQETYVAGTESWTADEDHEKFAMKFTCNDILNAYRPEFETFYVSE